MRDQHTRVKRAKDLSTRNFAEKSDLERFYFCDDIQPSKAAKFDLTFFIPIVALCLTFPEPQESHYLDKYRESYDRITTAWSEATAH